MLQKFLITITTLLILFCLTTQDVSAEKNKNIFKPGLYSLQFGVTNDLDLDSFKGSFFSVKRYLSNRSAISLRFSIQRYSIDEDGTNITVYPDTTQTYLFKNNRENNSTLIELSYIHYISYKKQIKGFIGAGPFISRSNSEYSETSPYNYNSTATRDDESKSHGLLFTFGTEWFVKDYMSFTLEYGLSYAKSETSYTYSYEYSYRDDITSRESDYTTFGTTDAIFGIAFYF